MIFFLTALTDEVKAFLNALDVHKKEAKLFQFLNGLNDVYSNQRSQILMMNELPSVEIACSLIQQEESQRNTLKIQDSADYEIAAMYSKGDNSERCFECGGKGHTKANYWTIIGYPKCIVNTRKLCLIREQVLLVNGREIETIEWQIMLLFKKVQMKTIVM